MHIINKNSDLTPRNTEKHGHVGVTKGRYGQPAAKCTGGRVRYESDGIKEHTLNFPYPL